MIRAAGRTGAHRVAARVEAGEARVVAVAEAEGVVEGLAAVRWRWRGEGRRETVAARGGGRVAVAEEAAAAGRAATRATAGKAVAGKVAAEKAEELAVVQAVTSVAAVTPVARRRRRRACVAAGGRVREEGKR